jgi:hypothetical protein
MKIKYTPILFIIIVVILGFLGNSFLKNESEGNYKVANPKPIKSTRDIIKEKISNSKFDNIKFFDFKSSDAKSSGLDKYVKSCTLLDLKKENLNKLVSLKNENIEFEIPLSEKSSVILMLTKVQVVPDNFKVNVITENGIEPYNYTPGSYYRGIVKDKPNSTAAVSIFANSVSGVISDETGNYNLAAMYDDIKGGKFIYYNENDLIVKKKFKCGVDDFGKLSNKNNYHSSANNLDNVNTRLAVRIYFVADYRMYQDNGSSTNNVVNFITTLFNSVSTIYSNEYLPIQMTNTVSVYTTPDPYRNLTDPIAILELFGDNTQDNFDGDLAHLLSTRNEQFGGISWVNSLCTSYNSTDHSGRFSFSGLDNVQSPPFPTYSWNVTVIAHEMGHSFGSQHTHACVWPITSTRIGQIDSCYTSEGGCVSGTEPNYNGTIMSYCHLNGATNLSLGFGSMPGDTIRLRYNECSKFGTVVNSSEVPTKFSLAQNFPNPFNPSTTINFAVPQDAFVTIKVYDLSGREIAELLNSKFYSAGFQNIIFNSSAHNLSSGVYFYKLIASNSAGGNVFSQVKKMILLK